MNWAKDIGLLVAGAILGALLTYAIDYKGTQTEIRMLTQERDREEDILKRISHVDTNVQLVLDAQGHVIGADVLTDSTGKVETDSNGSPVTSSPRRQ